MPPKVVLAGRIRVRPDRRDEFLAAATAVLAPSRAEEGCISYGFFFDGVDSDAALWFEEWRSRADLDAHFETPHFKALVAAFPEVTDGGPTITVFEIAAEEAL